MSAQMVAAEIVLRAVARRRLRRATVAELRRKDVHDPPPAVATGRDVEVEDAGGARLVWLDRARAARGGVVVHVHGGAMVSGPFAGHWDWLVALADGLDAAGVLVDYGLAPEHPHPAGRDACVAAFARGRAEADDAGTRCLVAADSAGGALTLSALAVLRDRGDALPDAVLLASPWLDLTLSGPVLAAAARRDAFVTVPMLTRSAADLAPGADLRDPEISPLHGDPAGLPPMLLHVGRRELVLPECRAWAHRCARAGVRCDLVEIRGGWHGCAIAGPRLPEARVALAEQLAFARAVGLG